MSGKWRPDVEVSPGLNRADISEALTDQDTPESRAAERELRRLWMLEDPFTVRAGEHTTREETKQ